MSRIWTHDIAHLSHHIFKEFFPEVSDLCHFLLCHPHSIDLCCVGLCFKSIFFTRSISVKTSPILVHFCISILSTMLGTKIYSTNNEWMNDQNKLLICFVWSKTNVVHYLSPVAVLITVCLWLISSGTAYALSSLHCMTPAELWVERYSWVLHVCSCSGKMLKEQ
jgi:hypothetical protein